MQCAHSIAGKGMSNEVVAPDGGWGWLVALGAALVQMQVVALVQMQVDGE